MEMIVIHVPQDKEDLCTPDSVKMILVAAGLLDLTDIVEEVL
jgi:hypothetical protein